MHILFCLKNEKNIIKGCHQNYLKTIILGYGYVELYDILFAMKELCKFFFTYKHILFFFL